MGPCLARDLVAQYRDFLVGQSPRDKELKRTAEESLVEGTGLEWVWKHQLQN